MTPIERVRCALAMLDAGYKVEFSSEDVEELLKAYDLQINKSQLPVSPEAIADLEERICRALATAFYKGKGLLALLSNRVDEHWEDFRPEAHALMLPQDFLG